MHVCAKKEEREKTETGTGAERSQTNFFGRKLVVQNFACIINHICLLQRTKHKSQLNWTESEFT